MVTGISVKITKIIEPERPRKIAVSTSEVILETMMANDGVWLRGNGSSDNLAFIELEIELFKAFIVKTPITSDSGDAFPRITIIRKVNTIALSNGSRTTQKSPSL